MRKAVFLDKDGTLIEDVPYSAGPPVFKPGVLDALKRVQNAGFALIVVTNQSGIAKGLISRDDLDRQRAELTARMAEHGLTIDGFYVCPHAMEDICGCRKPEPGMLFKASDQLCINLGASWMIGDKPSDQEAGVNAGCSAILLGSMTITDAVDLICVLA
jgi:D-glycero-D-manno-heptose 1,7-bisphosphate phosphatase